MLRMISAGPCQNGHELPLSYNALLQAPKVVCPVCEIVVKDREGQTGVYQLKYNKDIREGFTPIPEEFMKEWSRSVFDVPKVFQWFCSSLSNKEAEVIALEAENRFLAISKQTMIDLIEEIIPQLRKVHKVNILVEGKIVGTTSITGFYHTNPVIHATIEFHKEFPIEKLKLDANELLQFVKLYDEMTEISNKAKPNFEQDWGPRDPSPGKIVPKKIIQNDDYTAVKKACGHSCKKCNEFNQYAESNQADGTYICYACRKGK